MKTIITKQAIITKLSAIALLTAFAFPSQAELITTGSTEATISNAAPTVTDNSVTGDLLFNLDSQLFNETGNYAGAFVSARENAEFALSANANGEADARAEITQTYTLINGANSGDYLFNYFIDSGVLNVNCASGFGRPIEIDAELESDFDFGGGGLADCGSGMTSNYATAAYEASVSLFRGNDSTEYFNSSVRISVDGDGVLLQENINEIQAGTAIRGMQSFGQGSEGTYTIAGGPNQIDLGTILAGETIVVKYKVSIVASTYLAGQGDISPDYLPSAFTGFGDPTGLQGSFMSSSLVPATVSAPGTVLLMGVGLFALAFARRKTAK